MRVCRFLIIPFHIIFFQNLLQNTEAFEEHFDIGFGF